MGLWGPGPERLWPGPGGGPRTEAIMKGKGTKGPNREGAGCHCPLPS